ncbi:MAG: hypothetical protein JO266_05870 [Acidobacteria bacterium]|nr:hypothetical protein [Acidobacteriota bacterium]
MDENLKAAAEKANDEASAYQAETTAEAQEDRIRDKTLDQTIADSFPTSDPPSSIPDPVAAHGIDRSSGSLDELIADLPPGSWAAISDSERRVVGTGATEKEALESAAGYQPSQLRVVRVPQDPEVPERAA